MRRIYLNTLVVVLLIAVSSCSYPRVKLPAGLANKGLLPLSSTDAFLGSNLFLAQEMERSTYLYNFINSRGGPAAIELEKTKLSPVRLLLYYLDKEAVYSASPEPGKQGAYEWIVRGPYQIDRQDYRHLQRLVGAKPIRPAFYIAGQQRHFQGSEVNQVAEIVRPEIPPTPLPTPTPTPRPRKRRTIVVRSTPTPTPTAFRPLNFDQLAIMMAKGYAERDRDGNIIHTVTRPNETLDLIARWYTGNSKNADQLKKLNNLEIESLPAGTRVRVPQELIKNDKSLPSDFN